MINVKNLIKYYHDAQRGQVKAVDDISFSCHGNEIFGLLGPNGAGKTTTLRMLATLLQPTAGTAEVNGYDITKNAQDVRSNIGFLSASTGLYPRLTAREVLRFFAQMHKLSPSLINQRLDEIIHLMGIESYAGVRCEKLSSGMKQKVSIARAIIHDPPIIILDEATVGLDVIAAAQTMHFIQKFREEGKCILYSTHIMSEAEKLCDRIAIIHNGKIRSIGSLDELRTQTGERYLEDIFLKLVGQPIERFK